MPSIVGAAWARSAKTTATITAISAALPPPHHTRRQRRCCRRAEAARCRSASRRSRRRCLVVLGPELMPAFLSPLCPVRRHLACAAVLALVALLPRAHGHLPRHARPRHTVGSNAAR